MSFKDFISTIKKKKKVVILFIGLIIIIAVAILLYFILKPTKNTGSLCKPSENICKNNASSMYNKCVPSDYCGGDKYGLTYNKDDCLCHLPCGKDQSEYPAGTEMNKQPDGSWIPRELIGCSQDSICQYLTPPRKCPGGTDIFCGKSVDVNGNIIFSGCLSSEEFTACGTTFCKLSDFDCHTDKGGYCSVKGCPVDTVVPCSVNSDCTHPGTSGTCITNDTALTDKKIHNIGYCDNSASISSVSNTCLKKSEIGQNGKSLVNCQGSIGVSVTDQTCGDTFLTKNCATTMCTNPSFKWLATDKQDNCIENQLCCKEGQRVVNKGKKPFCCATDTDDGCLNDTLYGYASGILNGGGSTDTITCNINQDCSSHNNELIKQLNGDSKLGDFNYVNMYCDTTHKVCKASCGYKNQTASDTNHYSVVDVTNKDTPNKSYSFCSLNNNNCKLIDGQEYTYNMVNGIPICINGTDSNDSNLYWSQVEPSAEYTTQFKTKFASTDGTTPCDITVCGSQQKYLQDVYNMKIEHDAQGGGGTCTFNQTCNSLLVKPTGATNSIIWSDLKDASKLNPIIPDNIHWNVANKIYQTRDNQTPGNTNCEGDSHGFKNNLTKSPQLPPSEGGTVCRDDIPGNDNVFEYQGNYCPITVLGACNR